jgi:dolichol-phosphate mannosyltransferase
LKIDLNDLTGGYRIYSAELLNALNLKDMQATGYCFQIEMAMAADLAGAVATEVPITFVERINGVSKMTKVDCYRSAYSDNPLGRSSQAQT